MTIKHEVTKDNGDGECRQFYFYGNKPFCGLLIIVLVISLGYQVSCNAMSYINQLSKKSHFSKVKFHIRKGEFML